MEAKLDNVLESMMQTDNAIGAIISDNQGLSYGAKGVANSQASGLITSIAEQASSIHPNLDAPVVILETENTSVTISKHGLHTGAVYRRKTQSKK